MVTADFVPRGLGVCEHRCCPPAVCDYVKDCHLHSDVALTVSVAGGREGFAPGVAPAGTTTEQNVGAA